MPTRTDTRSKIVEVAQQLLLERGYNGFSYQDISKPLGVKNAAIHYHFPTKEDLGVALINDFREVLRARTTDFMQSGGNPVNQLEGYIGFILDSFQRDQTICPMGILAVDLYTLPEKMRIHAQLLVHEMIRWLTRVLDAGRDAGLFFFNGPAVDKAVVVKSVLQGAAQLARLNGAGILDHAVVQLRRDLGRA